MRYLVLSDIHGNRFGLEAVLAHAAQKYDAALCLGDVVGYGAHPNECCDILRGLGVATILGNHDVAALGYLNIDGFNDIARAAMEWTREHLSKENWIWLNGLDLTMEMEVGAFQATHGSLQEPFYEEYLLGVGDADGSFRLMTHPLCFFGHTHRAGYFRCPNPLRPQDDIDWVALPVGGTVEINPAGWKYLINPGSCGQPRDGNPQARYAIYDTESRCVAIRAVDYDVQSACDTIIAARLPRSLGDRLWEGQ